MSAGDDDGAEVLEFVRGTRLKIAGLTAFKKGAAVTVQGLAPQTRSAYLNDRTGEIAGYDDTRKRWVVDFGTRLGKKLFKEANLRSAELVVAAPVATSVKTPEEPSALGSNGDAVATVSGTSGTVPGEDDADEVIDFFPGIQVCVAGLGAKHEDLNGKTGTLVEFNKEKERWIVQMEDGLGKKMFRQVNLLTKGTASQALDRPQQPLTSEDAEAAIQARMPPAAEDGAPERPRTLRPGAQVLVQGLPGRGLARLNGQVGVCEDCDFTSGCWSVFFSDGYKEQLRPEYLTYQPPTLRPGAYVKLHSLQSAQHLNGKLGVCGKRDGSGLRWEVHLETGESKMLKPDNLAAQDSYTAPREGDSSELNVAATFEQALQSGEISWLDC